MKVTMLGCGASTGVPAIGPNWGACDPADPRNRRRRVSLLVEIGKVAILIDTSPDLREQLIDARVRRLDGVVMTHAHADHLHGIDDIRQLNRLMSSAIPLWADAETLAEIRRRFAYALLPPPEPGRFYKPTLEANELWIVDCMRRAPHPTHSHLEKTLGWIERVRPRRAVLTHMDYTLDYATLAAELPAGVEPGQDGLVIELPGP